MHKKERKIRGKYALIFLKENVIFFL